jgi:hypothetical protein
LHRAIVLADDPQGDTFLQEVIIKPLTEKYDYKIEYRSAEKIKSGSFNIFSQENIDNLFL